jgi:NADH:ubiquinone oxidoreductase subunit 3 (subunit A)
LAGRLLGGKKHQDAVKLAPYECGIPSQEKKDTKVSVKFYLIAMLFILFDVEVVWFFPWAVILRELKWVGLAEMFCFVFVLFLILAGIFPGCKKENKPEVRVDNTVTRYTGSLKTATEKAKDVTAKANQAIAIQNSTQQELQDPQ